MGKHLIDNQQQHNSVLVLKSEFNTTWNNFNASELVNTILGYWHDWLQHAETGNYTLKFPRYSMDRADIEDTETELTIPLTDLDSLVTPLPDVHKLDILNRRMIVSHKCTHNLFNLTSLWKKIVLLTWTSMSFRTIQISQVSIVLIWT